MGTGGGKKPEESSPRELVAYNWDKKVRRKNFRHRRDCQLFLHLGWKMIRGSSPSGERVAGHFRRSEKREKMVRERGLEPPPLAGPDPKSGVSAISPLAQVDEPT